MWKILLFLLPSATFGNEVADCQKNIFDAGIVEGPEFDRCLDLVLQEDAIEEQTQQAAPPNYGVRNPECGDNSGVIFLHGLGPKMSTMCKLFGTVGSGLSYRKNYVRCPGAPRRPVGMVPPTFLFPFLNSWFNFWCLPGMSVLSPFSCESQAGMDKALTWVEAEIESLMAEGVCSENIIIAGASQGGVMTIWTAFHSKYKLGGFVPIVTWAPLRKIYDYPTNPVNRDTPILYLNGLFDPIVPVYPATQKTKEVLNSVFTNVDAKLRPGTHTTTINPLTLVTMAKWMCQNTNVKLSSLHPVALTARAFNFGGCQGDGKKLIPFIPLIGK